MTTSENDRSVLKVLDRNIDHVFQVPAKRINEGPDVTFFLSSLAYADIMTWLLQLNGSVFPRKSQDKPQSETWKINSVSISPQTQRLVDLLVKLNDFIEQSPPEPGPRRFGNVAFRTWYRLVEENLEALFDKALPEVFTSFPSPEARAELRAYFLGSFGSAERLDYGSGHELSFVAFLGGVWKLGGFTEAQDGSEERGIVLHVIAKYLDLIRRLIKVYNLEPAGSHGVWGLDDHSFVPYIFGSAQYAPAISDVSQIPPEGSLPSSPDPGDVTKLASVERERRANLYFGAIGFIYDVKKGPFWEHSPMLFDISGVKGGWAKINKGMLKMYNAEVLSKFPVVQHFPFGSLYKWEHDEHAKPSILSTHVSSQPTPGLPKPGMSTAPSKRAPSNLNPPAAGFVGTAAPWARNASVQDPTAGSRPMAPTGSSARQNQSMGPTKAPWANR